MRFFVILSVLVAISSSALAKEVKTDPTQIHCAFQAMKLGLLGPATVPSSGSKKTSALAN